MNKTDQSAGPRPTPQTVAPKIQFESANQSIPIEFTDQQLSPHAGTATFWAFLHESGWLALLGKCLPPPLPKSNNHLLAAMFLPVLNKAKCKAQGIACMNNGRQMMMA